MAILNNNKNDTTISLTLKTISESPAWLSYDLRISIKKNLEMIEFLRITNNEQYLYFENEIEPEVPFLLNSLNALTLDTINHLFFEPVDEKDFSLTIKKEEHTYTVSLFVKNPIILNSIEWDVRSMIGLQMCVTKENLINFMNELKIEYFNLCGQKLLTLK